MAGTAGAPVVLGYCAGRTPWTLLLYHHYDVAPPGPWRAWSHEPFQLAERDGAVYGRGVAHGKGPLAAHLAALQALLEIDGALPCNVLFVVEGDGLNGSPYLASMINAHCQQVQADACLGSGGERDEQGRPFCYSGAKGLLRVRLTSRGPSIALPSGIATSVHNPAWRLAWALSQIKGEDEDIRISGFYDDVEGPSRSENTTFRQIQLDEAGRLESWRISEFLFGMSGVALVRAEATLPTCNLAGLSIEGPSDSATVPASATGQLDFHLVPKQQPDLILRLLHEHLIARNFGDIKVEMLPGGYPPAQTDADQPFIQHLVEAGAAVYNEPLAVLPLGPFAQPLQVFAQILDIPVASIGFWHHSSGIYAPDEKMALDDLLRHGQVLIEILATLSAKHALGDSNTHLTAAYGRATIAMPEIQSGVDDSPPLETDSPG
ncbi:MAG: M20/M25/M40 family metallo-hydrolase [Chloroflexales bacterium]|nr:M20/M25/M40 family metallo-hydrolase [Chloroflexales bacterium]